MCCGNWKVMAVFAGLFTLIFFFVAPGWDTAAAAVGFGVIAALSKWLEARGMLAGQCAIPQQFSESTKEVKQGRQGTLAQLRSQLQSLQAQEAFLEEQIERMEPETVKKDGRRASGSEMVSGSKPGGAKL